MGLLNRWDGGVGWGIGGIVGGTWGFCGGADGDFVVNGILCYVEGLMAGLPVGVERADGDEAVEIMCTAHEESEAISWRVAAGDGGSTKPWRT